MFNWFRGKSPKESRVNNRIAPPIPPPSEKEEIVRAFMAKLKERHAELSKDIDWGWDFRGDSIFWGSSLPNGIWSTLSGSPVNQPVSPPRHFMDEGETKAFERGRLEGYWEMDRLFRGIALKGRERKGEYAYGLFTEPSVLRSYRMIWKDTKEKV